MSIGVTEAALGFVFLSALALMLWAFAVYPLYIGTVVWTRDAEAEAVPAQDRLPRVSVILPAYNEERVIERRILNLWQQDYPLGLLEIIIIASGSNDRTTEIVNELLSGARNTSPETQLILEGNRSGKANAIMQGLERAKGEIIVITDANTKFVPGTIRNLAEAFDCSEIGAAGGRYITDRTSCSVSATEASFWDVESVLLCGESMLHSPCYVNGSVSAFRKEFAHPQRDAIADDFEMWLEVIRSGKRCRYAPHAIAFEMSSTNLREQIVQRRRTALGTLRALWKYRRYLAKPVDRYRALILPSHRLIPMMTPFLIIALLGPLILADSQLSRSLWSVLIGGFAIALSSIAIVSILTRDCYSENSDSTFRRIDWRGLLVRLPRSFALLTAFFLTNQYILLLAWMDFVTGKKDVKWEKAQSTRG